MKNMILFLVLVLLVTSCGGTQARPSPTPQAELIPAVVSASGKVLPARWANLSFRVSGRVVEVPVQAGDKVKAGQVVARLDDGDARLALAQANAALKMAQAQLAQLKAGARVEEITQQQQAVQAAQAALSGASARLEQLQRGPRQAELAAAESGLRQAEAEWKVQADNYKANLREGNLGLTEEHLRYRLQAAEEAVKAARARWEQLKVGATEAELRAARAEVLAAQAQVDSAQARLNQMLAGPTAEERAVSEANAAQMQAAAELAQAALDKTQLKAPFAGTVGNVYAREGEMLATGQTVIAVGDLASLRVETTDLSEVDVARVTVGQAVNVTFDGLPSKTLKGRVTRISPMSGGGQGGVNYAVVVELAQLDTALRWGMTAFTDIAVK